MISRVSARIAPIVNSATALALRPGVLTTRILRSRAAFMSILTGPPRDTAISFRLRQAIHHAAGERRELRDDDLSVADHGDDLVRAALIFLQPVHAGLRIAVLHRLVRPGQFERADVEIARRISRGSPSRTWTAT